MHASKFTATLIDQGYVFNAQQWHFPDSPLRGVYARNCVYEPRRRKRMAVVSR
jgi:hypothetical protein